MGSLFRSAEGDSSFRLIFNEVAEDEAVGDVEGCLLLFGQVLKKRCRCVLEAVNVLRLGDRFEHRNTAIDAPQCAKEGKLHSDVVRKKEDGRRPFIEPKSNRVLKYPKYFGCVLKR